MGLLTGGLAYAAAPALGFAFAGAVGGAAAGATGAALSGGNIWKGALIGFVGGGVGLGVGSEIGGTWGVFAGAIACGVAAAGVHSIVHGGNFFENAIVGAAVQSTMASLQLAAMKGWEYAREFTDGVARASVKHGGSLTVEAGQIRTDGQLPCVGDCRSIFTGMGQQGVESAHRYSHDSFLGRFINLTSKVHDFMSGFTYADGAFVGRGIVFNSAFDALYSFPTMIPSAVYTGFAFYGNPYSYSVPLR